MKKEKCVYLLYQSPHVPMFLIHLRGDSKLQNKTNFIINREYLCYNSTFLISKERPELPADVF